MDSIKVLTYNLCWGCMNADNSSKSDRTAKVLATTCELLRNTNNNNHVCLKNVAEFIDNKCQDYDFIGTQENGNYEVLNNTSFVLKGMGYVSHFVNKGRAKFVTYYNTSRYILLGGKVGDLIIKNSTAKGRPYQILFFEDNKTKNNIIFINVHNSHHDGRKRILENFKELTNGFLANGQTNINLKSNYGNFDISNLITDKQFKIIMAGDHNDHSTDESNFHQGIKPFANSKYPNLKDINLSTQSHIPPKSCCDTQRTKQHRDFRYSDYILISDNLEFITPNKIADIEYDSVIYPTSDHLPVIAEIKYKTVTPINPITSISSVKKIKPTVFTELQSPKGILTTTGVTHNSHPPGVGLESYVSGINFNLINFINYT